MIAFLYRQLSCRTMTKDLLVRGMDDEIHSKLGNVADTLGVSLNSIVKDAIDKWLEQNSQQIQKHELILYHDDKSLSNLLKSVNHIAKGENIFRACCGPKGHVGIKFLEKHGWFNATIEPFNEFLNKPYQYTTKILQLVGDKVGRKQLFGMAFLAGHIAKNKSIEEATKFCQWYGEKNVPGITHCVAKADIFFSSGVTNMLEFFNIHDQVFIVQDDKLHKLHLSHENVHKLFMN